MYKRCTIGKNRNSGTYPSYTKVQCRNDEVKRETRTLRSITISDFNLHVTRVPRDVTLIHVDNINLILNKFLAFFHNGQL